MPKSPKSANPGGRRPTLDATGQTEMYEKSVEQEALEAKPVECLGRTFPNDEARREYFLGELREKLKDPKFRNTEGFPIGEDEDILRMSDPPYFTACPNPFLAQVIAHHKPARETRPPYSRDPFATDVSEGKNDPIYNAHSYHTKVPHQAIMQYILHYTDPGDIVLDTFCGSGMTGVAATMCGSADPALRERMLSLSPTARWGSRLAILNDLGPAASLIAHNYNAAFDVPSEIKRASRLLDEIESDLGWAFRTSHTGWPSADRDSFSRANQQSSSIDGVVNFVLWSDMFTCPTCATALAYWNVAADPATASLKDEFFCCSCNALLKKADLERVTEVVVDPILHRSITRTKQLPVLINYSVGSRRYEKRPDARDLATLTESDSMKIPPPIPDQPFMLKGERWGDTWRAGYHFGVTHAHHFYTRRNLAVLARVWDVAVRTRSPFLQFLFTSTHAWATKMNRLLVSNYFNKKGGVIGQTLSGTMYLSSVSVETNAIARFRLRLESACHTAHSTGVFVTTQSATDLSAVPSQSVDYAFIDPPFGENLFYSELNFLWEAWIKVYTNNTSEAVVSNAQEKPLGTYLKLMTKAFQEVHRVLKEHHWITVEFHNSRNAVWNAIQEAILRAGFVIADVRTLEKTHKTYKQAVSTNAVKQDLAISAYRPSDAMVSRFELAAGTPSGAWEFVREHLRILPVVVEGEGAVELLAERQAFLLFDRMVAFHVQRGASVPLSAAEFYRGLREVFSERDEMFFLAEQVIEYDRARAKMGRVAQLSLFVSDEKSAIQWLRYQLKVKPRSFQEMQPLFLRELHKAGHEELPELTKILEQNFLKDEEARWYVPDPDRQRDLERVRERVLLQEYGEYAKGASKRLRVLRTESVRAGFRAAFEAKDYKEIVRIGKLIPESVLHADEQLLMYYDVAALRLGED